eukprot:655763-Pyramimonas_sp.AAC.1
MTAPASYPVGRLLPPSFAFAFAFASADVFADLFAGPARGDDLADCAKHGDGVGFGASPLVLEGRFARRLELLRGHLVLKGSGERTTGIRARVSRNIE